MTQDSLSKLALPLSKLLIKTYSSALCWHHIWGHWNCFVMCLSPCRNISKITLYLWYMYICIHMYTCFFNLGFVLLLVVHFWASYSFLILNFLIHRMGIITELTLKGHCEDWFNVNLLSHINFPNTYKQSYPQIYKLSGASDVQLTMKFSLFLSTRMAAH